jgi:RNA polymerase sigma-70 factor (ECF subfamily)
MFDTPETAVQDTPVTRPSLLLRLRDPQDAVAWNDFVQIYAPLIRRFGLRHGLQDADADDVTQEVLRCVAEAIGRWEYDPRAGRFRSWLFTITRHQLVNHVERRKHQVRATGDTAMQQLLENLPAAEDAEAYWDQEYERQLFRWAADQVRMQFSEVHWQAFWRTAVEQQDAAEVAVSLQMSVGALYVAKSRVLAQLRNKIQELGER